MKGAAAEVELVVGEADTAIAHQSGDVAVLATPRVLALVEQAAVAALGDQLTEANTSVGVHAELHHTKATAVGGTVVASAAITAENGRTIDFEVVVTERGKVVASGTHRRVIVDRTRFET